MDRDWVGVAGAKLRVEFRNQKFENRKIISGSGTQTQPSLIPRWFDMVWKWADGTNANLRVDFRNQKLDIRSIIYFQSPTSHIQPLSATRELN